MYFIFKFFFFVSFCAIAATGARLKSSRRLEFLEIVETYGYSGEYHYVTTEDGYILRIDRITSSPSIPNAHQKPVVFIQPGLISCSELFVFWDRYNSLAFSLADAGYDVWVGNSRGTTNSRNHTTLSPDSKPFWNFNLQDLSVKDLPAMLDYVLNTTNHQELSYIGHSLGTTFTYILLSERPEYKEKINLAVHLAPIANWTPRSVLFFKPILNIAIGTIRRVWLASDYAVEIFRSSGFVTNFCDGILSDDLCAFALNIFAGNPSVPFDDDDAEFVTRYVPAGASLQVLHHLTQNMKSGNLTKYDYGNKKNQEMYGQNKPPVYDISKISTPMAIFWSHGDLFATEDNVAELVTALPNVISNNEIEDPKFTHPDYFFHADAKNMYIDKVLELINQYKA